MQQLDFWKLFDTDTSFRGKKLTNKRFAILHIAPFLCLP